MGNTYLSFQEASQPEKKTRRWIIFNRQTNGCLGEIAYFPHWRKYVFQAHNDPIFDINCLTEVTDFLAAHRNDRQPSETGR